MTSSTTEPTTLDPEQIRKGAAVLQRMIDAAVAGAVAAEREFTRSCIAAIEAEAAAHYTSGKGGPRLERALEDVMATCVIQLNRLHERSAAAAPTPQGDGLACCPWEGTNRCCTERAPREVR